MASVGPVSIELRLNYGLWQTEDLPTRSVDLPVISRASRRSLKVMISVSLAVMSSLVLFILLVLTDNTTKTSPNLSQTSISAAFLIVLWGFSLLVITRSLLRALRVCLMVNSDIVVDSTGLISPRDFVGVLPWNQIAEMRLDSKGKRAFGIGVTLRDSKFINDYFMRRILAGTWKPNSLYFTLTYNENSGLLGEAIVETARQLGRATVKYPGA
jgi:hypothetical protein